MLFDLQNDPDELVNLGNDPAVFPEIKRLKEMHFSWTRITTGLQNLPRWLKK